MASFGRITIEVKRGSELVAMNPGKTANPFVRVSAGKNSFDTEVVEKTINPVFANGKHVFPPCPLPTILTINVFNKLIYLEEDEPMGTATVTIFSAGPEITKNVFLTHGGNVKLAAKARGGCGSLELVYTVTPTDTLDEPSAVGTSATAQVASKLESSMPDFLMETGVGGGTHKPHHAAEDDPFDAMFGEKPPPSVATPEVLAPPQSAAAIEHSLPITPSVPVASHPEVHSISTPVSEAPSAVMHTVEPTSAPPVEPNTASNPTLNGSGMSTTSMSTPAATTPATSDAPGPLGHPVITSTATSTGYAPAAASSTAASSVVGTPTTTNPTNDSSLKGFAPPPPMPPAADEQPKPAVAKQVTFDGNAIKKLAPPQPASHRSPSASRTGASILTKPSSASSTRGTPQVRGSSASRAPSNTVRKTVTAPIPSATTSLHNTHTSASSAKAHATFSSPTNTVHVPITSSQQLQHTNPHVGYLYTGERGRALLTAAQAGSQTEFVQVKDLDPLLINGFLAVKDYAGRNALHLAAWHGNPAILDMLLNGRNASGVAPRLDLTTLTTASGNTLLHCAALGGDPRTVEWLLFQPLCQALLVTQNRRGMTPYQVALEAGNTECASAIQAIANRSATF